MDISKHKGICKGKTQGDTASNTLRSLQGGKTERMVQFLK